jgi:HNH endonuclease
MPGYLLNWKRKLKDGFVWETLMRDIESTRNGIPVPAKWFVNRQESIREGDRVFVLAQGGPYLKPQQINGLIAAGYAAPVPAGKMPVRIGHVVYQDEGFRSGNYISAVLSTVLSPELVLPVSELESTGNLRHVEWKNVQSPGAEIRPHRKLKMNLDVLPELEELWERHLEKITFPLPPDADERFAIERFGQEGRLKVQVHKRRERDGALPRLKKAEALHLHGKLECEVCSFVFATRYGDHGSNFIECHHRESLATLDPNDGKRTTLEDLALVCANCHRMLHWRDLPSIVELRSRLRL